MSAPDTAALVKEYRENGFAVAERLFDPSEVAELNTAITEILNVPDIGAVAEVEPGDNGMARRIWSPTACANVCSVRRRARMTRCSNRSG